jgi:hypothetical protein
MIRGRFRIHRQLSELYRDHDVYITENPELSFNDFVCISHHNGKKKKRIYVWVRVIDDYYRMFYNTTSEWRFKGVSQHQITEGDAIVLCRHYRRLLGLDEASLDGVDLEIKKSRNPLKKIRALLNAPDSLVRTTTCISIISVFLGLVALILGIRSLH